jgi:arabinofuranosyltransferase
VRPAGPGWIAAAPWVVGLVAVAALCLKNAWAADDAYITFRSVEQLLAGHGPRWNPHERVQVFTHPLWFVAVTVARVALGDMYLAALATSLACVLATAWWMRRFFVTETAWLLAIGLLLSSKAFVDFAASGLENPLSALLVAVFLTLLSAPADGAVAPRQALRLTLAFGLALTCRHDLATLLAVPWAWWLLRHRDAPRAPLVRAVLVGLGPIVAWTVFSVVYYGFPFPNTAYAKLMAVPPDGLLWSQGAAYFRDSLQRDPLTLAVLAAGLAVGAAGRDAAGRAVAAGVACNLLYVLRIGGDFMSGRFFTSALVASLWLLARSSWPLLRARSSPFVAVALLAAYNLLAPGAPWRRVRVDATQGAIPGNRIVDEITWYYQGSSLPDWARRGPGSPFPRHPWFLAGLEFAASSQRITVRQTIGYFGFAARLDQIIVDHHAISDPFLARLPVLWGTWRPGHFMRDIPVGYSASLRDGTNEITDPAQRALYDDVVLVTRGPLFSAARWRAIVRLNLR